MGFSKECYAPWVYQGKGVRVTLDQPVRIDLGMYGSLETFIVGSFKRCM